MHLKEKGFVTVTILALISQVWSDLNGSRNRRATDEREQPRIITTNGHLLFQTGENHNITFKTGTSGRVLIGEEDLTDTINTVRGNKGTIEGLQTQLNDALQQLQQLQNAITTLTSRVESLENQDTEPDIGGEVMEQIATLQNDVDSLKSGLQMNECYSNPCQNGGTCTNLYNGYQCQCPDGWTGVTCSRDVNECTLIAGTPAACQNGGSCVNQDGSYRCQCTSDWYGPKCTIQYDDCTTASHGQLCGHGYCVNEARVDGTPKYSCICFDGWKTDSSSTNPACNIDINECDSSPCFEDVTCVNVPGTYFCGNCPTGFTGNGIQCSDINECLINNGGCSLSPLVTCTNTRGSRECGTCPTGYMGDGVTCTYVGVCNINNGGCNSMATCTENTGVISGRTCTCPDGYTGNGEGLNGCAPTSHACTNNPCMYGRCVPDGSSYSCICIPGFTGRNCETDVDDCVGVICQNGGTCLDDRNGYRCICASGYTGTLCEDSTLSCGGTYMSELGSFSFPGAGQNYPHGASCTWTITTSIDKVLRVEFNRLKIELHESCDFDYVRIFDGPSPSSFPLSEQICGNTVPDAHTSTRNVVTIQFVSDTSVSGEGFTLQWSSVDPECGGTLDDSNYGDISSPGYPGNYPVLRDCTWSITVEAGRYIMFAFASIDLQESSDCSKDYLEVFDGLSDEASLLGQYCSNVSPTPLQTTGPYAFVRFHSDDSTTAQGFHITYTSALIDPGCGGALTDAPGVIISPNYPNDYNHNAECVWTIQLPEGESIRFEITDLQLETHGSCIYDYVEVRDGFDETAPFVGRYCDSSSLPPPLISSSNQLNIKFHSDASRAFGGFRAIYSVDCGGVFTEDNGELVSPYFPNPYPHGNTCEYVVTAGPGQGVQVTFVTIAIEYHGSCQYDYLEAHDGATEDAPVIGRYCGAILPDSFTTTQSSLYMKFVTDGSVTNYGFKLTYTFVDVEPPSGGCGGYFSSPTGIISSPTHPELYPHNIHCIYVVEVNPGNVVRLTFTSFILESHSYCGYDYVEIYDNSTTSGNALLGRYCGSNSPPVITSSGNILTVVFHTDGSVSYDGFTSSYVSLDSSSVCGYALTATSGVVESPGYPSQYSNNADCEWTITVPSGQQISVNVTHIDIESTNGCAADYLELRNGGYSTSPLITTLCGTNLPSQLYVSHSNRMYLKFRSNQAITGTGFSLNYDGTATGCGGTLASPTGSFMSPNFPNPYYHNAQCNWIISVNQGSRVTLTFSDFNVEYDSSCDYDSVKVYDGSDTHSVLLGDFCGSDVPEPVTSTGHQMYVRYTTDSSVARRGFLASYTADCEEVQLTQRTGYIESTNYPDAYPHNQDCSWILEAPLGNSVNITFLDINLEYHGTCNFDYIKLYDADTATGSPLATLCGTEADGTSFVSTGNQLRLEFHSDVSIALAGFRAYYVLNNCGDELTGNSGEFTSLNYPDPYDHSSTCDWTITVEYGHSITLNIEDIDLEQSTSCSYDSLQIYTGSDDQGMLLAEICDQSDERRQVSTTGNRMFVRFTTDESVNGGGFRASYVSNPGDCSNSTISDKNVTNVTKNQTNICVPGCGGNYSLPTGVIHSLYYPSPYPHFSDCSWLITVEEGARVELTFTSFQLESAYGCVYDYVKVYDGDSSSSPLLQTLCGQLYSPTTIISTTNVIFVRMYSDVSVAYSGFEATYNTGCGGRRDASAGGFISSPNFPQPYSGDHNCSWILESSDPADRITLTFVALDLETSPLGCYDYVDIMLGGNPSENSRVCGTLLPSPVTSFGSSLTVNFVSDGSNHGSGFKVFYSTTGAACGGDLTASSGTFASPGYPDSYSTTTECVWTVPVTPGSRLQISFSMFEIESSTNCSTDFLELREVNENGDVLGQFCGSDTPSTLTLTSSVWIRFQSDDSGTAPGFVAAFQEVLGGEVTGSSGTIVSPNFPNLYDDDLNVNWLITVEADFFIRMDITSINIEGGSNCPFDALRIYDGASNQNGILAVICGTPGDQVVYTTGNSAFVEFSTDSSIPGSGFRLEWQTDTFVTVEPPELTTGVVDTGCNQALTATAVSQTFTSPGYPGNYANDLHCRYIITAQPTSTIMLNFTDFELEYSGSCVFDYVRIFDGTTEGDNILGNYCGSSTEVVYSTGRSMMVVFHSDASETYLGFSATFREHCGGTYRMQEGVISSPGYPGDYGNDLNCTYLIETTPGFIIVFQLVDIDIEESPSCNKDSLRVYNGREETSPPLGAGTFCGSGSPSGHIRSSSNVIRARFVTDDSGTGDGFSFSYLTFSDSCGGIHTLSDSVPSGQIASPNYPSNYPQNADCYWIINSPAGTVIKVNFEDDFFIESHTSCHYDYVQVYDGSLSTSNVLGTFCGNFAPTPVTSTANAMRIRFRTDGSVTHVGFSLNYSIAQCGGYASGMSGTISSPGFPGNYGSDLTCEWHFQGPSGHYLTISFISFTIQSSENCSSDFLAIYDGNNASRPLLGKFCGSSSVPSVDTGSSIAYLKFVSDASVTAAGFQISFEASEQVCGGDLVTPTGTLQSPGYPYNYDHRRVCEWKITVQEGHLVNLYFNDMDMENSPNCMFDSVKIYNGLEDDAPLIASVCGVVPPDKISSSGRTMRVVFSTDHSIHGRGFQARYDSLDSSVCGGSIQTTPPSTGMISSPGYELSNYSTDLSCDWTLSNTQLLNTSLLLTFDDGWGLEPAPECIHDYVEIRQGVNANGPLIGKFCGSVAPRPISVPWNSLFIRFRTDDSIADKGFRMTYQGTDCGGIVTGTSGVITSPNFPELYRDQDHCAWLIQAPAGSIIAMTFTNFTVEGGDNCPYDHVFIKSGGNWDSPSFSGEVGWCSSNLPPEQNIVTSSNQAIVIFTTDAGVAGSGFRLEWSTETTGCGGMFHGSSGSIQSSNYSAGYGPNEECVWMLSVETGYNIILTFVDDYDVLSGDVITIFDGLNTDATIIQTFDTSRPSQPIQSSFNAIMVRFRTDGTRGGRGFRATWSTGCGGTITALSGRITSQGYPYRNYDDDVHCEYIIEGQSSSSLLITFDDLFNLEAGSDCSYDYLSFYDGRDNSGRLLGKFCDSGTPDQIENSGPVFVVFHTDGNINENGFGFTFEPGCGGTFTEESGVVGTPLHLDTYRHSQNCTFLIQVSERKSVQLRFTNFSLEQHPDCGYDYVVVYDGSDTDSSPLTGPLCGSSLPSQLTSTGNTMLLNFVTDSSIAREGFQATYQAVYGPAVGCGGTKTEATGTIQSLDLDLDENYEPNLDCTWNIGLSDTSKVIRIEFQERWGIQASRDSCVDDYLEIRDGFGIYAPLVGRFCGSSVPPALQLSGSQAYLRFVSDSDIEDVGFTLNYDSVNRTCGGLLEATEEVQRVTSPNYPESYSDNTMCTWIISAASVYDKVRLITTDIDIEDHTACLYDYVQFTDFPRSGDAQDVHYCGQDIPAPFNSAGRSAQIYFSTDLNSSGKGFSINYLIADCNQSLSSSFGHLTSPGYPASYNNNHSCTTQLSSPSGTFLALYFDDFQLESGGDCVFDHLRVRDGPSSNSSEVLFACSNVTPDPVFASGNSLYLEFVSDSTITLRGYSITYTSSSISAGCGGSLSGQSGSFTSPNFPSAYAANLTCDWSIEVPARRQPVSLEFTVFSVEGVEGVCQQDYVEVYSGTTATHTLIGRYCGANIPAKITSTVSIRNLFVRFVTNSNNSGEEDFTGFRAVYTS